MKPTEFEVARFREGWLRGELHRTAQEDYAIDLLVARTRVTRAEARTILEAEMQCTFDGCTEKVHAKGLCAGHYSQRGRHEDLRPLKWKRGEGEGEMVAFKAPAELKEAAEKDADQEGVNPSEWWRRAGRERLERRGKR